MRGAAEFPHRIWEEGGETNREGGRWGPGWRWLGGEQGERGRRLDEGGEGSEVRVWGAGVGVLGRG